MATNYQLEMDKLKGTVGGLTINDITDADNHEAAFALGQILGRTNAKQMLRQILAGWLSRGSESVMISSITAAFEHAAEEADSQSECDHWRAVSQWISQSPDP